MGDGGKRAFEACRAPHQTVVIPEASQRLSGIQGTGPMRYGCPWVPDKRYALSGMTILVETGG